MKHTGAIYLIGKDISIEDFLSAVNPLISFKKLATDKKDTTESLLIKRTSLAFDNVIYDGQLYNTGLIILSEYFNQEDNEDDTLEDCLTHTSLFKKQLVSAIQQLKEKDSELAENMASFDEDGNFKAYCRCLQICNKYDEVKGLHFSYIKRFVPEALRQSRGMIEDFQIKVDPSKK